MTSRQISRNFSGLIRATNSGLSANGRDKLATKYAFDFGCPKVEKKIFTPQSRGVVVSGLRGEFLDSETVPPFSEKLAKKYPAETNFRRRFLLEITRWHN